ncbi:hypothetical protein [Chryseobacterium daeguense]|uniref:hypothetical protein n=1 Tax=Chryseobacterium daeguense TaxID=412438 RepID=UPI00040183F6|nr:hypothetical protein [Chryseobacterium daeguense]
MNKKDSVAIKKYGIYESFSNKILDDFNLKLQKNTDSSNIQKYIEITKKYDYMENGWLLL